MSEILYRIIFLFWGSLIGALSIVQRAEWPLEMALGDILQHLGAYAVLAGLAALGFQARRPWIVLAIPLIAYGGILELVQLAVPGRFASVWDLLANAAGVIVGIVAIRLAGHRPKTLR